jgi:hypothetical protein
LEPKKSEIFSVKKINLPFSSIKVLEDQILINYNKNKVKIFNTQFKEISSFNTIKKVDKIIEIKKNFIAFFFYDDKNYEIWEKIGIYYQLKKTFSLKTNFKCWKNWKNYFIERENGIIELFTDSYPKYYEINDYKEGIIINENHIFYNKNQSKGEIFFNFKENKIIRTCNFEIFNFLNFLNPFIIVSNQDGGYLFLNINNFQIEIIIKYYISRINIFEWKNKKFFIINNSSKILVLNYETFEIIQEINVSPYSGFHQFNNSFLFDGNECYSLLEN